MLDLTREELAQRIGCAVNTLYKIEADARRPSKQIAELLAEHLNIPFDQHAAFVQFARAQSKIAARFHPPTNLPPASPTPLIGRVEAIDSIYERLIQTDARLLTLVGAPGIGKTRLALQVAAQALDDFLDGVYFVNLAPITDAHLVLTAISNALGIPDMGTRTPLEQLKHYLGDKQMLLVLDNFEQILTAAPYLAELLAACPWLKLMITSRTPLRIRAEHQIPVAPLALPDVARVSDARMIAQFSAIALFLERARAVRPDFALTENNAKTVAAICTRLDGLPLAIELISARVKLLPPAALLERLSGRLLLQSDGLRDIEPRHRTLNNAIESSYQLLSTEEQTLFRRLGVFVGGWTLEAAEEVCSENLTLPILDGIASLLDKSLINQTATANGEPRFMMLETIREYALERLIASEELDTARQHHLEHFVRFAESAETHAFGREQVLWHDRLEAELENLRAALTWSLDSEAGLWLAAALGWFFYKRTHWNEGLGWLERTLAMNSNAPASLRAKALQIAGKLAASLHDPRWKMYCEQALTLARSLNDRWNMAWALTFLGFHSSADLDRSATQLEESLVLFREIDDPFGLSYALFYRAYRALDQKDYAFVQQLMGELAAIAYESSDPFMLAEVSYLEGRLAWHAHDHPQVKRHYEASLAFFREARDQDGISRTIVNLAAIEQAMGNMERARILNEEALLLHREIALDHPRAPFIFCGLAGVAISHRQYERAARLLGAANSDWLTQFAHLHPEIAPFEQEVEQAHTQLGEVAFATAWAEGQAMTHDQAIAYALEETNISFE